MGHRERCDRQDKAIRQGKNGFHAGFTLEANPYKISTWGVGAFWMLGWNDAKQQASIKRDDTGEQKP